VKVDPKKRGHPSKPASAHIDRGAFGARDSRAHGQPRATRQADNGQIPEMPVINARILYEDEDTGERGEVTLVYPNAADAGSGHLSVLEPLGMALLGLREGESVDWPLHNGTRQRIRLVSVLPVRPRRKAGR
jgi:regulator of nucleoside diphosphate kinase